MKFTFINPKRRYSRFNIWRYINPIIPPLGLATLAAVLEEQGCSVVIIDAHAEQLNDEEILRRVGTPDFIGITSTTPEIDEAKRLSVLLRTQVPGARVIMGGAHPTVEHVDLVRGGWCDAVVRGEGEMPLLYLAKGVPWDDVRNLTWMDDMGQVVVNQGGGPVMDLDTMPFPAYHLLPMHKYKPALGAAKKTPAYGIITSRGCPGGCKFCLSGSNPEKTRYVSAERVLEHIKLLVEQYGAKEILFYDDTFTGSQKRVVEICNKLICSNINICWVCFARVDTVNPAVLELMKRAGCHQISYGIESPDADILALMNKRIKTDRVHLAVAWAKAAQIDVRGAFMLGSPGETKKTMKKTIDYAVELQVEYAMFNITTPFPGTILYKEAEEKGWIAHKNWLNYDLAHPVLNLPTVSQKAVKQYYGKAYRTFYISPHYWWKKFTRILGLKTKTVFRPNGLFHEAVTD